MVAYVTTIFRGRANFLCTSTDSEDCSKVRHAAPCGADEVIVHRGNELSCYPRHAISIHSRARSDVGNVNRRRLPIAYLAVGQQT